MVGGAASRLLIDVYRYINTRFNALYNPIGLKAGMVYSGSNITLEILDPHLYRSDVNELLLLSQNFKSNENYSFLVNKEYLIIFKITYNNKSYYGLGTTLGVSFVSYTVGYVTVEDNGNGLLSSVLESNKSSSFGLMSKFKSKIRLFKLVNSPNGSTFAFDILRRVI